MPAKKKSSKKSGDSSNFTEESTVANSYTSSASQGVPFGVKKQLAQDIEDAGGFEKFNLKDKNCFSDIYNKRPHIYGCLGDTRRSQLSNLKYRWKKLFRENKYDTLVIEKFQVKRRQPGQEEENKSTNCTGDNSDNSSISSKSSSSDCSSHYSKESSSVGNLSVEEIIAPINTISFEDGKKESEKKTVREKMSEKRKAARKASYLAVPKDCEVITVDVDNPEKNRELQVMKMDSVKGFNDKDTLYPGILITVPYEVGYVYGDSTTEYYKAKIYTENSVLVTIPSYPFNFLKSADDLRNLDVDEEIVDSVINAAHQYFVHEENVRDMESNDRLESRQWKHILCKFPDDYQLSSEVINGPKFENGMLEYDLIPFQDGQVYACWKIARLEKGSFKKGKLGMKKSAAKSRGATLLEKIGSPSRGKYDATVNRPEAPTSNVKVETTNNDSDSATISSFVSDDSIEFPDAPTFELILNQMKMSEAATRKKKIKPDNVSSKPDNISSSVRVTRSVASTIKNGLGLFAKKTEDVHDEEEDNDLIMNDKTFQSKRKYHWMNDDGEFKND